MREAARELLEYIGVDDIGVSWPVDRDGHSLSDEVDEAVRKLDAALAASSIDVERLARAVTAVAIEDRDRVIRGDYAATTHAIHAARLAAEYDRLSRIEDTEPAKEPTDGDV